MENTKKTVIEFAQAAKELGARAIIPGSGSEMSIDKFIAMVNNMGIRNEVLAKNARFTLIF